jgi:hypothetical protein
MQITQIVKSAINQQQHDPKCLFIGHMGTAASLPGLITSCLLPQNEMHNNLQKKYIHAVWTSFQAKLHCLICQKQIHWIHGHIGRGCRIEFDTDSLECIPSSSCEILSPARSFDVTATILQQTCINKSTYWKMWLNRQIINQDQHDM